MPGAYDANMLIDTGTGQGNWHLANATYRRPRYVQQHIVGSNCRLLKLSCLVLIKENQPVTIETKKMNIH